VIRSAALSGKTFRSKQSCSKLKPFDLGGQLGMIIDSEIAGNHVGRTTVNPASNR
jgi:hypothetical protein